MQVCKVWACEIVRQLSKSKLYVQIDQTKISSVALATECDNLDENELGSVAMSLEKSDHGFI